MKYNALSVDHYQQSWGGPLSAYAAGEKTKPMLIRLTQILDRLEPQGDDHLHTIWVKVKRPTFRQFYEYHYGYEIPYKEAADEVIREAKEYYADAYPHPKVWYRLSTKHFSLDESEEFYAFFLDNNYAFSVNDRNAKQEYDDPELLQWAIEEAELFVAEVQKNTYESHILRKIPFCYREGKIKRKDLWEACPEAKKEFFKNYKRKEINKFLSVFRSGETRNTPLRDMTARQFYEACAVVYKALDFHRKNAVYLFEENDAERKHYGECEQTPKEMYYAIADGRDDGLKDVPLDDPAAFYQWLCKEGPYYEFNGAHPWEIIPSMSISHSMHLYPRKNERQEWNFLLSGESDFRAPETVIAANALYDAGYPVEVYGFDRIINRIEGNDELSVVPKRESTFFSESIHLPEGKVGAAVAEKTVWEFDRYRMKISRSTFADA